MNGFVPPPPLPLPIPTMPRPLRIYSVSFHAGQMNFAAFHQYLTDNRDIEGFWNYIPFVYFIKTRVDLGDMSNRLRPFFPGNYMLAEIYGHRAMQGALPVEAWNWFNTDIPSGNVMIGPPAPPRTF